LSKFLTAFCVYVVLFMLPLASSAQALSGETAPLPASPSATSPAASAVDSRAIPGADRLATFASTKEVATGGKGTTSLCDLSDSKKVPAYTLVVVLQKVQCTSKLGARFNKWHYEVLIGGNVWRIAERDLDITAESAAQVELFTPEVVAANRENWRIVSLEAYVRQLKDVKAQLDATSKYGVALLQTRLFDTSEYTEGTGFSVRVLNTGKKAIKYITFSLVGLNAVDDPVKGRHQRSATVTLRGIGPIEPNHSGTYTEKYMWSTDLVESFNLLSIRVEYMDGTQKTIPGTAKLRIPPSDVALMDFAE